MLVDLKKNDIFRRFNGKGSLSEKTKLDCACCSVLFSFKFS